MRSRRGSASRFSPSDGGDAGGTQVAAEKVKATTQRGVDKAVTDPKDHATQNARIDSAIHSDSQSSGSSKLLLNLIGRLVINSHSCRQFDSQFVLGEAHAVGERTLDLEQGAESAMILQNLEKTDNEGIATLTEGSENTSLSVTRDRRIGQRARQRSVFPHGARDSGKIGIDLTQALGLGRSAIQRCGIRGSDTHA